MDTATVASVVAVAVAVATLALTGPAVGVVDVGPSQASELGEGTAAVDDVAFDHRPVVTPGRFGSGVAYLRIPDARVRLSSIGGRSQIVYRVTVPALSFDRVGQRAVSPDAADSVTVGMADRAFEYARIDRDTYEATVAVSVQSFAVDRAVYRENVTVEVRIDD